MHSYDSNYYETSYKLLYLTCFKNEHNLSHRHTRNRFVDILLYLLLKMYTIYIQLQQGN